MSAFPPVFAGRRYAVVGLGRNGLPVARALAAMGADVHVWDDDPIARSTAGMPRMEPDALPVGLDALVLSPGIPHRLPAPHPAAARASALGIPILSDAELLFQAVRRAGSAARFVGITGTNGKSTTTALLAHILAGAGVPVAAGGNLGPAALALPLLPDHGVYVLEMSSYMLERLATLRFDAAIMLNLSPDHLDRHGDMAGYEAAKRHIFDRQGPGDLGLMGQTDAPLVANPALPGPHNAQNAAAARALARHLGVDDRAIDQGIATFAGLPHRQQIVGHTAGVVFVNDSKATNADATARALACYESCVWIAGGLGKADGIAPLAPLFDRVAHAVLIGRDAPRFADTLKDVPHTITGTLDEAVPLAFAHARRAAVPVVLLSPAAASFDQFTGFEARGDRFAALVAMLRDAA